MPVSYGSGKRLLVGYSRLCHLLLFSRPLTIQAAAFGIHSSGSSSITTTSKHIAFASHATVHSGITASTALFSTMTSDRHPVTASPILTFGSNVEKLGDEEYAATVLMGKKDMLDKHAAALLRETLGLAMDDNLLERMLNDIDAKSGGSSSTLLAASAGGPTMMHRLTICGLPHHDSRNLSPSSFHAIPALVKSQLIFTNDVSDSIGPYAAAVSKAVPLFSLKTTSSPPSNLRNIGVSFVDAQGSLVTDETQLQAAQVVSESVQLAARLVDMHPEQLTTTQFVKEVQTLLDDKLEHVKMTEITGDDLIQYGGLHAVGRAAEHPPRLVILEYDGRSKSNDKGQSSEHSTVALVGKGIVYDTGGLALKSKDGMSGMKGDMGGAAALLGGFYAACRLKVQRKIVLILCLAENAIGPTAFRNDDILIMYSGKSVEVNNPDAEGRLVLADGVAHATKHIEDLGLVVDMATLTGAQLVATGKTHAGILTNSKEVEEQAVLAGLKSGDYVFPMVYCPELLMDEFKSEVADMKNSVKDRGNAQSSCAGHFVESHLNKGYTGDWLHVDIAGPAWRDGRGTAFGTGFVLSILGVDGW
ncbi:hypothetical protein MPSEU_000535200 [Mayamaea pseudoterrestris]|nr:hypothetical protein MPSEU_000535200 [Mayamaea pseudoterrestris]